MYFHSFFDFLTPFFSYRYTILSTYSTKIQINHIEFIGKIYSFILETDINNGNIHNIEWFPTIDKRLIDKK